MRYERVAEADRDLEAASARLELIDRLASLFRETPTELLPTVALLCQGEIAPDFAGVELGLAERLGPVPVDAVYSSPLERCQETAAVVADAKGLKVQTLEDLGEVRYGDWTGRSLKELAREPLWKVVQATPSAARFPEGESLSGHCAQYCGLKHSDMVFTVDAMAPAEFRAWAAEARR